MAGPTIQLESVANVITERLSDMLNANVYVVDDSGRMVSSSETIESWRPAGVETEEDGAYYMRIPLRFNGHTGDVIVSAPGGAEPASPRMAQMLVDLMISQVLATAHLSDRQELKNKFIYDLLHGGLTDEADIIREGEILGLSFARPRAVLLIEAEYITESAAAWQNEITLQARVQRRAQSVIASVVRFFRLSSDAICAYIGGGRVAVLKASRTQDLEAWADVTPPANPSWADIAALKKACEALVDQLQRDTGGEVSIGVGRYHPGVLGLVSSYEDARTALELGARLHGPNGVYCLDELGEAAFVGIQDLPTRVDLARHLLSPLKSEPDLMETVKAFLDEDCCPSTTAERLSIHRNTLLYRLQKVGLLTGLDPRRFRDAVQLSLALVLLAIN